MASINKLSIRGVRSFSPDDKEQVVEFYFPCTIIVGANGCGKTTIIESLKFAVCGALPPGNKSGQAFIHDPRSIGHSDVKANIKLRITNKGGKSMVVVRSMEVSQKKTKMTFKQLDGVIRTTDDHGNRQALSHKCTELDTIIPSMLGVSKPILEHVIFCHQEDSSWPLQEGAVLKKRFDDIFDSTRYSKALEVFAKQKKEFTASAKDLKADVASFTSHRHAARGFQQEIEKYADQAEGLEEKIENSRKNLSTFEEDKAELLKIIEQVEDTRLQIEQRKNEVCNLQSVVAKQRQMLQDDLTDTHSVRELKEMLRDFDQQMSKRIGKKKELEDDIQYRVEQVEAFRREETGLLEHVGRLKSEKENHDKNLKQRYDKMVELGQKYGLESVLSQASLTQLTQTQVSMFQSSSFTADTSVLGGQAQDQAVIEISVEDMEEFFRALEKKKQELQDELISHKSKYQQQEDQLQNVLADLQGRQKSIENERTKLNQKQTDARKELQQISSQLSTTSRLRKGDVEDAKRQAAKHGKERDEANSNPRRNQIPIEIRSNEEKIDKLKREIEDDHIALKELRHSAEAQNSIGILREQCLKDLENLQENIYEQSYVLQRFNIAVPKELPGSTGGDAHGDELSTAMEKVVDDVTSKWDKLNLDVSKAGEEKSRVARIVTEKSTFVAHNAQNLASKQARLVQLESGCIVEVRKVVDKLKRFEQSLGVVTPDVNESKPEELLAYIASRMEEAENESSEGMGPDTIRRIIKRLKKLSKANYSESGCFQCPCCARDMETDEQIVKFREQMDALMKADSPLVKTDTRVENALPKYKKWHAAVSGNLSGILDYRRIVNEINDIEKTVEELEKALAESNAELQILDARYKESESEAKDLRDLLDSARRWSDAASRISEKRMQASQKHTDLGLMNSDLGGRDLPTVERELQERLDKKELYATQINRLNKEMSALNNRITQLSNTATRLDQLARDKESKFGKEQQMSERKAILNDTIAGCASEERKLQEQIAPLRQKQRTKETEKQRMRTIADDEEAKLINKNNSFISDFKDLRRLTDDIASFTGSGKDTELDELFAKSSGIAEESKKKQADIDAIKPELERLVKAIEDEERHKSNLKENIELIESGTRLKDMEDEIEKLEERAGAVEGHDNASDDLEKLNRKHQKTIASQARLEGRRAEIVESIRSFKRKLKQPEYKDVEEEYRIAMIKHETTLMAVRDIDKYYSALDQALLQFHGIKIAEINQIIRDLWRLTYKGEDITNIELVSGQESGSRASRSYNYRVVMTKGNTKMDMRGRCSAGQRVLASIVIRLALAETFCVNCGCIALDEPTVNLDFNNKRGLAIALAQIIATRSTQSNFQLIMITHDEDFVAMMKTELASQSGFTMPEKYFQVRREEGADGKYYSKIDAVDWDELV